MTCLRKMTCLTIVLLVMMCLCLIQVNGNKEHPNGHWPLKDSRRNFDLDTAYDVALDLQHQLLKEFKHLKNQLASMQADAPMDRDDLAERRDEIFRRVDTTSDRFDKAQTQLLRSKLEEHDSYLRMLTQLFKGQLESIAKQINSKLETQEQHLNRIESQIDGLNQSLMLENFSHHEEFGKNLKTSDWFIKGIYDSVVARRDCADVRAGGQNTSGVYRIFPGNVAKRMEALVLCDMDSNGNAWLVFQQRKSGNVNFERNWKDYATGFGDLRDEFWLGNDLLHALTSNRNYKLHIDMEDFDGQKRYAEYANFSVSSSADNYRLTVADYSGDAGDSFSHHGGLQFSTIDADHDTAPTASCAQLYHGGWWYSACHGSNLNGRYLRGNHTSYANGVNWVSFRGYHHSLKVTQMKITPVNS